jgi:hypothetical protein
VDWVERWERWEWEGGAEGGILEFFFVDEDWLDAEGGGGRWWEVDNKW